MFRRKTLAAVATAAALALTLSACGGSESPADGSSSGGSSGGGTLTLGLVQPASTFSAADMAFANESPYGQAVYDSLLRETPDGEVTAHLATEWSYNDDKTVLTMKLRDDVTFTDGEKFTADVAAQNLTRFKAGTSPNAPFLAAMTEAKAVDETTLELTLSAPDPVLLGYLAKNAGMMQSPASFENADIQTNPVGSGPYVLDTGATVIGTSYAFTKNPDYWLPESVHYDNLQLNVYQDPTSMLNAVKGGQLNGAKLINNDALDQVTGAGYDLHPFELDWTGLMLMDRDGTVNPALGDVRVRQAINHAFDREALLQAIGKGYGTVTTQIFPTSSTAYDEGLDEAYPYDPAKAKKLLAEAGFPSGFTLDMPSTQALGSAIWTIIGQQLADVGITVNFTDVGNNFISDVLASKYSATWFQLQQDPNWALIQFAIAPDATWNPFGAQTPELNELIESIPGASESEQDDASKAINEYIVDQAWFAPWYRIESNYATDSKTDVVPQVGNAYPYLWNFKPAA